MSSEDEMPPILDGPFTPVRDYEDPFEDAPPQMEALGDKKTEDNAFKIKERLETSRFNGDNFICLDAAQVESGRFKAFRFLGRFMLDYIWNSSYPEDVLKSLFLMCLTYAAKGAEAMNIVANHFIFLLTARHLDYEIAVHFKNIKKIDGSMAETILTRFEIVDQSNKAKERPSICEESFVIDITAIESGKQRKKLAGKGRSSDFNIPYSICDGATFELTNNDNFCLFRAFEFLRMKHVLPQQRFSEYKCDQTRQLNDVTALCHACGIDVGLPFYSIEEYGERIQMCPIIKRNFAYFSRTEKMELPVITTRLNMLAKYLERGIIALDVKCHMIHKAGTIQNASGSATTANALVQGSGETVTMPTMVFSRLAWNTFKCRKCYEHHAKLSQCKIKRGTEVATIEKSICKSSKKCVDCGVIYQIRHHKQKAHECGQKFCKVCLGFHVPRECYIPYRPKKKTEKRIIFFDFECTTDFKPDPELLRFKHQVNFCYAHVTCTECIAKGIWDQPLERSCGICGMTRTFAWAPFEFYDTEVETAYVVDDPLTAFTKWLLHFEADVLGIDPAEKHRKRKRKNGDNNNARNPAADAFLDMEAEDDDSDDNDAENNYMLGYDEEGEKPRSVTTYAYAHAGSRYDHVLIYGEMLRMGVRPELVRQGNHLLEMKARERGAITTTIFRDSYKLIPIKLASFVKTFGLQIDGVDNKKYFPHKFNKAANYGVVLDSLPPLDDYYPGGHFPEERKKLEQWYEENRNTPFDLREVIADYCKADVQILAHGMVKMRQLFRTATSQELTDSITIPSACMKFFVVLSHFGKERIAIIPHLGYEKRGKQSAIARKYLKWRAEEEMRDNGWTLRHVESPGGEYKHGNFLLDGMLERIGEDKNLAIEVNGCYWHACPHCFPEDDAIVGGGETAGAIRATDAKRIRQIARDFEVEIVWECQLARMLETDPPMRAFFDNTPDSGPIDFHDAFFGGRTGPEWLGASIIPDREGQAGRTIKVKDFNSLYPSRNMFTNYPVGHPKVIQMDKDVNWTSKEHIVDDDGVKMEGIIKCFVVPPRHCLYDIPVIPMRHNNRTLFPLCRKCAEMYPKGLVDDGYNCPHFEDAERGFSTTIPHIELEAALRSGYRVTHVYRAYVWPLYCDWSNGLFHSYLNKFLRIKFEASGFPADCAAADIDEEERERRKEQYINNPWKGCTVQLDANNIKPNPGMRYLSKLCLNSLWGRFALRNRLTKTEIIDCHADLAKLLNDVKIDISSIDQLTEKFWMVCYKAKDEHVVEHDTSNVAIALWTTAAARVHLLNSLQLVYSQENLVQRYDTRILYMDTDSIFYEFKTALGDPLKGGNQLGELADEYPSHTIIEFICAGPKAYALWLRNNATGEDEYKLKLRGITLDSNACTRINFEKMKEMVLEKWGTPGNHVRFDYPTKNFRITKQGDILTVPITKQFNPTVNKGVLRDRGLKVVPFGYSTWEYCKAHNPYECRCKKE
ncbi:hypothetical protein niasHT_013256 [Heterodera trifolii]|uniref:DNA-directed DNA polymerase n=1 Tax=Heterodera trifolii TaxID=157864 RepID=A0ABD2LKE0_9BILA